jgi:hypothetical protein
VTDETFEDGAIDIRLAVALDYEVLSWTMSTVINILSGAAREVTITGHKALPLATTHVSTVR